MKFRHLLEVTIISTALAMTSPASARPPWGYGNPMPPNGNAPGWSGAPAPWSNHYQTPWNQPRYYQIVEGWGRVPVPRNNNHRWRGNTMPWGYGINRYQVPRNHHRGKNGTPWDRSPWGNMSGPWDNGPWNSHWQGGPWKKNNRFWGDGDGLSAWMDPADPKGSMERIWNDMLDAPYEMGEMPGGWTAPSISVPNPVGVGDEFEGSSRKAPKETAEQLNNFRLN